MRLINDFIDKEYKNYAREVVFKRAIPYFIDGFKDGGRKIFYYLKHNKNKFIKVSAIAGGIIERCEYHHSETSAQTTIINMGKFYEGSNNLPIAIPDGHFGSKILKGSASARYIFASYNKLMDYIFLDDYLTKTDDSDAPEPNFYLPIIPMNIVNGEKGIAIGYAVNIMSHNPLSLIDFMMNKLKVKKTVDIQPFYHGCDYSYERIDDLTYSIQPTNISFKKDKIIVTELKPEMDREKFTTILINLVETKQIKSFRDESKEKFKFIIKNLKLTEENVLDKLHLVANIKQNINTIEKETVKSFNSIEEFATAFTDTRLSYYSKRKTYMKRHYEHLKSLNNALISFIHNSIVLTKSKYYIV